MKLKNVCTSITDCPHSSPTWVDHGILAIRNYNLVDGRVDFSQASYVTENEYKARIRRAVPEEGDIVLSREAPIGNIGLIPPGLKCCLGQRVVLLKVDKTICYPEYLVYILMSREIQHQMKHSEGTGTTVSNLRIQHIENIEINLPDLEVQKRFISIISPIDGLIIALSSIKDNLDTQMKALYSELFSKGSIINYGRLGDYCDIQKGLSYKGSGLSETEGALLINLGNITPGGGYRKDKEKYYTGEYKQKNVVQPGDLIIANTDMTYNRVILGSPIIVPDFQGTVLFTHHLFAFMDLKLPRAYLYYYLRTDEFHGLCESSANGTTVLAITREDVLNAEIPIPDSSALCAFDKVASIALKTISENEKESANLMALRDYLLPKLMSDELDVSTLEIPN